MATAVNQYYWRKKNMNKLSLKQKNWLLSSHIAFGSLWTGTVLSMALVALRNRNTLNDEALYALNSIINVLDDFVVIPSAIGSVLTATLLCWVTNYGFVKFYWVIVKWILTIALIIFGTFWLYPWSEAATSISDTQGLRAFENQLYMFDTKGVLIGCIVQVLFLFIVIGISVLKPWGRRSLNNIDQDKAVSTGR